MDFKVYAHPLLIEPDFNLSMTLCSLDLLIDAYQH